MFIICLIQLLVLIARISYASQLENIQQQLGIEKSSIPSLKLSNNSNNALEIFGEFESFSFLRYWGQENFTQGIASNSSSRDLIYYSNNTFVKLIEGNENVRINSIVPFGSDCFILSGTGSLLGFQLEKQLLYNLTNMTVQPIFETEFSVINAILVDEENVYFGGNFTFTSRSNSSLAGHSIVVWDSVSNSTSLLPFIGFGQDSVINSILKLDDDNILFAGSFNTLDDSVLLETDRSETNYSTNSSTPIQLGQIVPLTYSNWSTEGSTFSKDSFICPNTNNDSWYMEGTTGSLEFTLPHSLISKKIRIYNSQIENNEISLFRIIAQPANGIMNLTYLDPLDGNQRFCDAFCPLVSRSQLAKSIGNSTQLIFIDNNLTDVGWTETYQEFAFVDDLSIASLEFLALDSYGKNIGLSSIQVFQETLPTYANNSLNKPDCNSDANYPRATLSDNEWYSDSESAGFIATVYTAGSEIYPKVSFYPIIKYKGEYTINIYTPGCSSDNSCSSRGIVNVTLWNSDDDLMINSVLLYQNNEQLKYDNIFSGSLDFSPVITLEYHSSVAPNNPLTIVVADFVDIIVNSLNFTNSTSVDSMDSLNGLFQYQKSNFTNGTTSKSIGNTTLNAYPIDNLPQNASLHACMYNDSVWIGGSVSGVARIELGDNLNVTSVERIGTGGEVEGISIYSGGIIMFGSFNLSSEVSTLTYNGTYNSLGNLNRTVQKFSNVTLEESELLIFDNENFFNVTSQSYISNSSSFSLSLWAAGQNSFGDMIFCGAVSESEYIDLNGSITIFGSNSSLNTISSSEKNAYKGIFLNESLSAYAIKDNVGAGSDLIFDFGAESPWSSFGLINSMLYSNNSTLLAVSSTEDTRYSSLNIFNLTSFEIIANETLASESIINSMILFEKNLTLLIAGNFSLPSANCSNLCLYEYEAKRWTSCGREFAAGNIKQIQIYSSTELLISGSWEINGTYETGLATLDISTFALNSQLGATGEDLSFISSNKDNIIAWNDTNLMEYANGEWQNLNVPDYFSISDVLEVSADGNIEKRNGGGSDGILIIGKSWNSSQNIIQSFFYDFETWLPYFSANLESTTQTDITFFTNEDVSRLYLTNEQLGNPNKTAQIPRTSSTSSATSSATSSSSASSQASKSSSRRKLDRGFVVLVGLALAVGTVTVIGITGVLLAYLFRENEEIEPVYSRADEAEMINTVPPEKLLKFL